MKKQSWKPGNVLWPLPVVMVSCGGTKQFKPNIITIAWVGTICSSPPMLSISVRPERYSYEIINTTGEFVVNIPSLREAKAVDWCGVVSGRDKDKFKEMNLTPAPALKTKCPIILECPINIECIVKKTLKLGTHTMFISEIIAVQVSDELLDKKGKFHFEKNGMISFANGQYFTLGKNIGHLGYTVRKNNKIRR
ncbi:flavin reductase family protein [Candidatus Desantisbacteria bacterium]|nr:flavin reductase family protein [Candidatus Desantisbacteria bacterium]